MFCVTLLLTFASADYTGVAELAQMSSLEAAMHMTVEVKVACVNGSNFYGDLGLDGRDGDVPYLRFAFCRSLPTIEAACVRLHERFAPAAAGAAGE